MHTYVATIKIENASMDDYEVLRSALRQKSYRTNFLPKEEYRLLAKPRYLQASKTGAWEQLVVELQTAGKILEKTYSFTLMKVKH